MLDGLQAEIDARPKLAGASKTIIMAELNAEGSADSEAWEAIPIDEQKITISRLALLTMLDGTQRAGIRTILANPDDAYQEDFKMLYEADDVYWVNSDAFRSMIDYLGQVLSLSAGKVTEIKRLGERSISRSEELFGRKITAEDFE